MARSFSSAKLLSDLAADAISNTVARGGYSAARCDAPSGKSAPAVKKTGEEEKMPRADGQASWATDPRTGYYRPENSIEETDVAEPWAELLRQKE